MYVFLLDLNLDNNGGRVWITAVHRPLLRQTDYSIKKPPRSASSQPTSVELKDVKGTFVHSVESDGTVDVCIRASPASTNNPLRFGLSIDKQYEEETTKKDSQDTLTVVGRHLSKMEQEATRLQRDMHEVLKEADLAKEREVVFHGQTLAMHSASIWWPVVQLSVLLVTGYTQASHIIRFFKSRHII